MPNSMIKNTYHVRNLGSDYDEKVTSHNSLGMVADESQPTLFWIWRAHWATGAQVLSHGAWRYFNPEFQSLSSLAIRSSPHVALSAAICRINC